MKKVSLAFWETGKRKKSDVGQVYFIVQSIELKRAKKGRVLRLDALDKNTPGALGMLYFSQVNM